MDDTDKKRIQNKLALLKFMMFCLGAGFMYACATRNWFGIGLALILLLMFMVYKMEEEL